MPARRISAALGLDTERTISRKPSTERGSEATSAAAAKRLSVATSAEIRVRSLKVTSTTSANSFSLEPK